MSDDDAPTEPGEAPPPPAPPAWLAPATLRAMEAARDRCLAWGGDARAAAEAAREVALAHLPALPLRMIAEAVSAAVPDPEGLGAAMPAALAAADGTALRPATAEELSEALCYALRFNERGRPRRTGVEQMAPLAAAQLVRHLALARFVVLRRPPLAPHPGY